MIKVYIASPYTIGDAAENVRVQILAADWLMDRGFACHVPLLSHFQHFVCPRPWSMWMEHDFEWLKQCDCILRLPGESQGADMEVDGARSLGMPVFYKKEDVIEFYKGGKK